MSPLTEHLDIAYLILVEYVQNPLGLFHYYRLISTAWEQKLASEKLVRVICSSSTHFKWKTVCLHTKCWFPYESEPANWCKLFELMYLTLPRYHSRCALLWQDVPDGQSTPYFPFEKTNSSSEFVYAFAVSILLNHSVHKASGQVFALETFQQWHSGHWTHLCDWVSVRQVC